MFKYELIIYWDSQDSCYVADVPELPGCKAHGRSYDKALSRAKEAIGLWLDTAKEFGDPVPQPKGQRLLYA
jgi:predicted RNase H-like HicB family nuclease